LNTPKEDCESLLNAVMPLVQQMLGQYQEFFPCGATMSPTGEIALAMPAGDDKDPNTDVLLSALEEGFRKQATEGTCRATALAVDVLMVPPGRTKKQDAVEVRLDHRDNYSMRVLFPYAVSDAGELTVEGPVTVSGNGLMFR
jgi:hypothetical protein